MPKIYELSVIDWISQWVSQFIWCRSAVFLEWTLFLLHLSNLLKKKFIKASNSRSHVCRNTQREQRNTWNGKEICTGTPPLKYFFTSDRTYWNHILGFRVWAFLSSKWLKSKKSDEPFLRNSNDDFWKIFLWFSLKGPIRFFCCQSIIVQGGPNVEF